MPNKKSNILSIFFRDSILLKLLLLLHFGTISLVLFAQNKNYVFTHYTTTTGLLSNRVSKAYQDKQGYLWIGSINGLQRFDGKRFVNYVSDLHNANALQTNWISDIFEDSKNRFWIGTLRGAVYTLDRNTGRFYDYNRSIKKAEDKLSGVSNIVEDSNNDIWLWERKGFYKLNNETNQFENYYKKLGFKNNTFASTIAKDNNGNLWFCSTEEIKFYDVKKKEVFDKNNNPLHWKIFEAAQLSPKVFVDIQNNIWFATPQNKVCRFNIISNQIIEYPYQKIFETTENIKPYKFNYQVRVIGSKNNIGFGFNERGFSLYNSSSDNFIFIPINKNSTYGLHNFFSGIQTVDMLTDNEGVIWFYGDNGLENFNPQKQPFHFIQTTSTSNHKTSLPAIEATGFMQSKLTNDIFISYYDVKSTGGIYKVDSNYNVKQHYNLQTNSESGTNQLWNLFEDAKGIIWSPTQNGTILKLNPLTNKLTETKDTSLSDNFNTIKKDADDNIWLGSWKKGLKKIDNKTGVVSTFIDPPKNIDLPIKCVFTICFDGDSLIRVGTSRFGLLCFDKRINKYVAAYTYNEDDIHSINSNIVVSILQYNTDTLLLATSEGINIFNKKTKQFSSITSKNGLPGNFVASIFFDRIKNIWVCCANGFCRLNASNWQVINYGTNDGIIECEFNGKYYLLPNNKILVGTTKGLLAFTANNVTESKAPSKVLITGLKLYGQHLNLDSLLQQHIPLKLKYNANTIAIEFASLSFNHQDKIKYYYQLEGVDKDWVLAGTEQAAYYNQLKNGTYIFKVKCENGDGIFCNQITTLNITILPPFYRTWWFVLLEIIVAGLIVFAFIRWRNKNTQQLKLIENEEQKIKQLETEKLKNQLEIEQVINFFSSSLVGKNTKETVLWDVARNLIGELNFYDCVIYLWNEDKTKLVKQAGFGSNEFMKDYEKEIPDVAPGQNVVGDVIISKEPIIIKNVFIIDKYKEKYPYRASIVAVPILFNNDLIGVIDSEHPQENYFTNRHLQLLTTIAAMVANKLHSLDAEQQLNKQLAETKMLALRSQMNPHFIFNSLNSINHFILSNDTDNASNYLTKFSRLIRLILDNSRTECGYLDNEIKALELYIQLEAVRFENAFSYEIFVNENVSVATILIPPLIIQPYVENAIWHGLLHKQTGEGKLQINIWMKDETLQIKITDNGVGREKATALKSNKTLLHKSHGMKITSERLEVINNLYKVNASVEITDLKDDQNQANGTSVLITIKPKTNASNYN